MLAALLTVAWTLCPANWDQVDRVALDFGNGSADISSEGQAQIAALLTPLVGNEMAEVQVRAYFPDGERSMSSVRLPTLADERVERVKKAVVGLGVSPDLVGTDVVALAVESGDGGVRSPLNGLQLVELDVRVKSDCHPLADLARRTNPYR